MSSTSASDLPPRNDVEAALAFARAAPERATPDVVEQLIMLQDDPAALIRALASLDLPRE